MWAYRLQAFIIHEAEQLKAFPNMPNREHRRLGINQAHHFKAISYK